MAKIRFELNIDEIVEVTGYVDHTHEAFKNESAEGKTFLFIDKLSGVLQAAYCKKSSSENNKYASVEFFPLAQNTTIIEYDVESKREELIDQIKDCFDNLRTAITEHHNDMAVFIGKEIDALKAEGLGGSGISEKTLLSALEIVTKKQV